MKMVETIKQTETNENPGDEVQEVKEGEAQAMTLEEALDQADDEFMDQIAEKSILMTSVLHNRQKNYLKQLVNNLVFKLVILMYTKQ